MLYNVLGWGMHRGHGERLDCGSNSSERLGFVQVFLHLGTPNARLG